MTTRREIDLRARAEAKRVSQAGIVYTAGLATIFLFSTLSLSAGRLSMWAPLVALATTFALFAIFQAVSRLYALVGDLAARDSSQTAD